MAGDESGPERGVSILLPSGGKIVVFGEPNSLEWKNPEQGVSTVLTRADCSSRQPEVREAGLGKLKGAKASLVCGDRVLKALLGFRPRGGPIYWLRLETDCAHELEDNAILENIAASFKLIKWE